MMSDSTATPDASPYSEIPVLLVDDHAIWRGGIKAMLEDTEFRVVGEAASGPEGVELARSLAPRLILLDIRMSGGDGLDALESLKEQAPGSAVIMLTTYDNPTYMARAVAAGAAGYLLKGVPFEELITALRAVVRGEMLISPQSLTKSLRSVSQNAALSRDLIQPLSVREEEVLRLLSTGLTNREIGVLLFISESTVKTHVEHIIGKLNVSDRVQAAVWAARHGLADEA